MDANEQTWESVARRLDEGRAGGSTAEQRLAEEILADEAYVGPRLDTRMPAGVLFRTGARLEEALASRPRVGRRWAWKSVAAVAAAAVAAAALLVFTLSGPDDQSQEPQQVLARLTPVEVADAYLAQTVAADDLGEEVEAMGAVAQYMSDTAGLFHPASFQPAYVDPEDPREEIFLDPWLFGVDSIPEL